VAADQPRRVGQPLQPGPDLQGVAAGGQQRRGRLQVASQRRLAGVDPLDLVGQQQPAGGELGRPGGQGRPGVGKVAEQEPAEDQVGRRARERHHGHVVHRELGR
jgi:hypothetical protein